MSEKPLFQDSDEQEAIYAPQPVPGGGPAESPPEVEGNQSGAQDLVETMLVPGTIAVGAGVGGTGPSTGAGTLSGVAPVAGAAAETTNAPTDEDTAGRPDEVKE
jgi:hypothetical protein